MAFSRDYSQELKSVDVIVYNKLDKIFNVGKATEFMVFCAVLLYSTEKEEFKTVKLINLLNDMNGKWIDRAKILYNLISNKDDELLNNMKDEHECFTFLLRLCNTFPKDPKMNNSIKRMKEPIYKMRMINTPVNQPQLFPKRYIKIEEPKVIEIKCEEEKEVEQDFIMINYDHGARTKVITEYIPKNCYTPIRYVDNGKLTDAALQKIIDDLR